MTNDIKHLFMCLLAICMSLEKFVFKSSSPYVILIIAFLLLSCKILYSGYCIGMYAIPVLAQAYEEVCAGSFIAHGCRWAKDM